jgi:hypothetical protein
MRSLLLFAIVSLSLAACVEVHNPPPEVQAQPSTSTVLVPATPPATTTIICPAGAISC